MIPFLNPLKLFLDYRLTDEAIEVLTFGGIVLKRFPLAEIKRIDQGLPFGLVHESWINRLDFWRSAVTIRRRGGLIRQVLITPENSGEFVSTARSLLRRF